MANNSLFQDQVEDVELTAFVEEIINQLTQHKLDFVRDLLTARNFRGVARLTKSELRDKLKYAITEGLVTEADLLVLLNELDSWGKQRILLRRFPPALLQDYRNLESFQRRVAETNFESLLNGQVSLTPTQELTPMRINLNIDGDAPLLTVVAAKTRDIWLPQQDIEPITDDNYPDIVFRPFKKENQKVIAFAEVNINSGYALISTNIIRQGQAYNAEFGEFYSLFGDVLPFDEMQKVELYQATRAIYDLPPTEIRLLSHNRSTSAGNRINYNSQSRSLDFRDDSEMTQSWRALPDASNHFCNCIWHPCPDLCEEVHLHVYARDGQITILREARESSVRYVLRQINRLN